MLESGESKGAPDEGKSTMALRVSRTAIRRMCLICMSAGWGYKTTLQLTWVHGLEGV